MLQSYGYSISGNPVIWIASPQFRSLSEAIQFWQRTANSWCLSWVIFGLLKGYDYIPSCILRFCRSKKVGQSSDKLDCLQQKRVYRNAHQYVTGSLSPYISVGQILSPLSPSEVRIHEYSRLSTMQIFVMSKERSIGHVLVSKSGEPSETQWKTQCPWYLPLRIICRWFVAAILGLSRDW